MPREAASHGAAPAGPAPLGVVGLYTNISRGRGAPVVTVSLQQPRALDADCVWFVRYDPPPDRPERGTADPLSAVAQSVLENGAILRAFRELVATRGVRAVLFSSSRGTAGLHGLLILPANTPKVGWGLGKCPHNSSTALVLVCKQTSLDALRWCVFGRTPRGTLLMRQDAYAETDHIPGLACTHPGGARAKGPFPVHFALMSVQKAVLAARTRVFGEHVLTVVCGQGGTWIPEPVLRFVPAAHGAQPASEFVGTDAWQRALDAVAGRTLVVGPLYFLAAASRYVRALRAPAMAEAEVSQCLYGAAGVAPAGAMFPPAAFLPPRLLVMWKDLPE